MTYNEIIQKEGRRISPQVVYRIDETEFIITRDDIKKARPFFNASLVGTVMKGFEIECTKEIPNVEIRFENIARFESDIQKGSYGPYYLKEKPEYNADSKTYSHKFYDGFLKTMVEYQPIKIEYPTTVFQYFLKLCEACGFTTNITSLPNGTKVIKKDIYENIGFTFRNVFDDIGQATGTLFQFDDFEIKKCSLGTEVITINDNILKNQNISIGVKVGPINSIVLARAGNADRIYKRDESLTEWNEFLISENQLMNDNDRDEYLEELYEALYGTEYYSFDFELVGFGIIDPLQKIKILTGEKEYFSYIFNCEEEFTQGYTQSIYSEPLEGSETDYSASDTTDRRINQTIAIVNKQERYIEQLVSDMYEENGIINEKFTQAYQDIDGFIKSVQNSGGSNLIYNSIMFAMQDGIPENWTVSGDGTLSTQSSPEAFNAGSQAGHTFTLQGKTVKQRVSVKRDDDSISEDQKTYYTFSCKIKKGTVGSCYVKISNSIEEYTINLGSGQESFYGDYEIKALLPKENYYDIEFYGSQESNATFTDVMFALGQYKTTWTQANGEIMNTQVVINQNGVLVKSSVYEGDYTVMSPLEFAGYSLINGVITKVFSLNKDTTNVKKMRVEDEIAMSPIKIVPILTGDVTGWALVKTGSDN